MPAPTNREEILVRLRESVSNGKAIVGAGAGQLHPMVQLHTVLHQINNATNNAFTQASASPPNLLKKAVAI